MTAIAPPPGPQAAAEAAVAARSTPVLDRVFPAPQCDDVAADAHLARWLVRRTERMIWDETHR